MATGIGKQKIVTDLGLLIAGGASTVIGSLVTKGTATDMLVTIISSAASGTIAGSTTVAVQGANNSASTLSNWTAVTPDKGTAVSPTTTTGAQSLHFAQLQYAYYRLYLVASTTATLATVVVWNLQGLQDSYDATVA